MDGETLTFVFFFFSGAKKNIFMEEDRKANMHVQQTEIPERLRQMVDMLVDEEARQEDNTTGVCMEYFLKNGVLQYLVNVSEKADYPVGIRGEAIRTIANMVDLLDDRFLVHNAVHKPTIKLLRFCVLDERQSDLYHEDLVDLMYIICSKIHGFPALLNIFFHDKQWLTTPQKAKHQQQQQNARAEEAAAGQREDQQSSAKTDNDQPAKKPEYEFLLFTYLLQFVHREGRAGDFARTGLLFLMEMATNQLGDFILDSDFATILAAGLGALYSQLPRKLAIKDEEELNGNVASYLLGQDLDPRAIPSGIGVELSSSPGFKYQLDSFLKLFEFCQDVLNRCPNRSISVRLLQSIRTIFLENILYPSILECSDIDGSSVAVISYIDLILQILQQEELADVVVGFLMDDEDAALGHLSDGAEGDNHVAYNSSNALSGIELDQFKSTSYFTAAERFTLKDLIFSRLKSNSQPTVIATLKLLRTLITKHCRYSLKLLSIYPEDDAGNKTDANGVCIPKKPSTIISHHIREIELYFSLISAIDETHAEEVLSSGYEDYLEDIENMLENDACYQNMITQNGAHHGSTGMRTPKSERRRSFKYGQRFDEKIREMLETGLIPESGCSKSAAKLFRHRIRTTDPLLQILLSLLSHFFAQSSELNLALTGVISALALCPYRSLEGWITFRESDRTDPDDVLVLSANGDVTDQLQNLRMNVLEEGDIKAGDIYARHDSIHVDEDAEDDDRSIDFGADKNSAKMTAPTHFKSFPPFFTLLRTLTQQIDYYRSEVDGFDKLLQERRNGLMIGDVEQPDPQSAMMITSSSTSTRRGSIHLNGVPAGKAADNNIIPQGSLSTASNAQTSSLATQMFSKRSAAMRPSSSTATNAASSLPTPARSISASTTSAVAAAAGTIMGPLSTYHNQLYNNTSSLPSVMQTNPILSNPISSIAVHTRKTQNIRIQPLFPSNFVTEHEEPILDLDEDDEDTFAPKAANPSQTRRLDKSTEISLSMLLNNVVILEETIKELVAIMQVRRSLGIDEIRYA